MKKLMQQKGLVIFALCFMAHLAFAQEQGKLQTDIEVIVLEDSLVAGVLAVNLHIPHPEETKQVFIQVGDQPDRGNFISKVLPIVEHKNKFYLRDGNTYFPLEDNQVKLMILKEKPKANQLAKLDSGLHLTAFSQDKKGGYSKKYYPKTKK